MGRLLTRRQLTLSGVDMVSPRLLVTSLLLLPLLTTCSVYLDGQRKVLLSWNTIGDGGTDLIAFQLEVRTTGWVGLGFSRPDNRTRADTIIAWVDQNGQGHISDRSGGFSELPAADESQDIVLLNSTESDGKTFVSFIRQIDTGDSETDLIIPRGSVRLLYAYGARDPAGNQLSADDYQGIETGAVNLRLLDAMAPPTSLPDGGLAFDTRANNYIIPDSEPLTYYCSFHATPNLTTKHHAVEIEPVITAGNEELVHRIILYSCWNVSADVVAGSPLREGLCFDPNMPDFADACRAIVYAWTAGASTLRLPDEVGLALGGSGHSSLNYFQLEIQYNNSTSTSGKMDSSGFRLHYTPTLRTYDMGTVRVGVVDSVIIPPKDESFPVTGYCHGSCTSEFVPPGNISIFGYILHAHQLATSVRVDHFRQGQHLGTIAHGQSSHQGLRGYRLFNQATVILAGDDVKVTCSMNSSLRDTISYGGRGEDEEVCLVYLLYYPRRAVSSCMSMAVYVDEADNILYNLLNITPSVNHFNFVNYREALSRVSWSEDKLCAARTAILQTAHYSVCSLTSYHALQSTFTRFQPLAPAEPDPDQELCTPEVSHTPDLQPGLGATDNFSDGSKADTSNRASLTWLHLLFIYYCCFGL